MALLEKAGLFFLFGRALSMCKKHGFIRSGFTLQSLFLRHKGFPLQPACRQRQVPHVKDIQDNIIKFQASNKYKFCKFDSRNGYQKLVMAYDPKIHKRRSIRLKGYDYSRAGLYFITICVQNRKHLFGVVENNEMILNDAGKMVHAEWEKLKDRFQNIELHEFIVMPNHFHSILEIPVGAPIVGDHNIMGIKNDYGEQMMDKIENQKIDENIQGQPQGIAPTVVPNKTVGDMMDAFKSITTVAYINGVKNFGWRTFDRKLWQRNYYENIIRDEIAFQNISNYIINNPAQWQRDKFYKK